MNVQTLENNNAWSHFTNLADAARVRNAGFDVPLVQQRSPAQKAPTPVRTANAMPVSTERGYQNQQPQKQQPILGTNFDAYA